jgi:hypothetical protein
MTVRIPAMIITVIAMKNINTTATKTFEKRNNTVITPITSASISDLYGALMELDNTAISNSAG